MLFGAGGSLATVSIAPSLGLASKRKAASAARKVSVGR